MRENLTLETHFLQDDHVMQSNFRLPKDGFLQSCIHNIRTSQCIRTKKTFLVVVWVKEYDTRLFALYTEVLMCDFTEGKNTEKGHCMHCCAKTWKINIPENLSASCHHRKSGF